MVEKEVEKKLIDFLSEAVPDVRFVGFWQSAQTGELRDEDYDGSVCARVRVSPRGYQKYLDPECTMSVSIDVSGSLSDDSTGGDFVSCCDLIQRRLFDLHGDGADETVLSAPGFDCNGIIVNPGDCEFVDEDKTYSANYQMTIFGNNTEVING